MEYYRIGIQYNRCGMPYYAHNSLLAHLRWCAAARCLCWRRLDLLRSVSSIGSAAGEAQPPAAARVHFDFQFVHEISGFSFGFLCGWRVKAVRHLLSNPIVYLLVSACHHQVEVIERERIDRGQVSALIEMSARRWKSLSLTMSMSTHPLKPCV